MVEMSSSETADIEQRELPKGAAEGALGLAGIAFVLMVIGVFAYGFLGSTLTAGLDTACADAAFQAGKRAEELGNFELALNRLRRAMEGEFRDKEQRLLCGRTIGDLLMREHRFAEAVSAYQSLPPEAFESAGSLTGYVTSLWRDGQLEKAQELGLRWLKKAEAEGSLEQTLWANSTLMHIADAREHPEDALRHGEAVTALEPGSDAGLFMAQLLHREGRIEEALTVLQRFLDNTKDTKLYADGKVLLETLQSAQ